MRTETLDKAETALRHAVTYRQFREVDERVMEYCREADRQLALLPERDARRKALLTHVLVVLEWTRLMLCASRAACAARLERAATIDRYLGSQSAAASPSTHLEF